MKTLLKTTVVAASLVGSSMALAAVPAGIDTAFVEAGTDATTVIGYIAGALVLLVSGFWVIKIIRKA